jgi:hypothetical protein
MEETTNKKTQNQMDRSHFLGYRNERGKLGRNTGVREVGGKSRLDIFL